MTPVNSQNSYFDICEKFFKKNVGKKDMIFSYFYDDVGYPTINEALLKNYPPDGRFYQLLKHRFIDFMRKPKRVVNFTDYTMSSTISFGNTPLEKSIVLIDQLIELVKDGEFNEQQIGAQLKKIAKESEVSSFLGVRLEEILCIKKSSETTRANQSYHRQRFKKAISNISLKSFSTVPLNKSIDYKNVNEQPIQFFELGLGSKSKAKELESGKIKNDYASLFLCFLFYLKASIYFKEALSLDIKFIIAKYNYSYTLKRLGKLDMALDHLLELKSWEFNSVKNESRVIESIGDIYLIKEDYKTAEQFFIEAHTLTPEDPEIAFNLLKVCVETKNNIKVSEMLDLLIKINQNKPINKKLKQHWNDLLNYIIENYCKNIANKSLTLKNKY